MGNEMWFRGELEKRLQGNNELSFIGLAIQYWESTNFRELDARRLRNQQSLTLEPDLNREILQPIFVKFGVPTEKSPYEA